LAIYRAPHNYASVPVRHQAIVRITHTSINFRFRYWDHIHAATNTWLSKQTPDFSLQLTIIDSYTPSSPLASARRHRPAFIFRPQYPPVTPAFRPIRGNAWSIGYPESVKLATEATRCLMALASDVSGCRPPSPPPRWPCPASQGRAKGQSPICPSSTWSRPPGCGRTSRPGNRTPGAGRRPAS
jgi:hypothetical protein